MTSANNVIVRRPGTPRVCAWEKWLGHLVTLSPCHLVIFLFLTLGCGLKPGPRPAQSEIERLPRLETMRPKQTLLDVSTELTATVEAMERTDLCAQVRGVVKQIPGE